MEIRRIKCKSGNEYNIVNEYWETSLAWGHKSTLVASYGEIVSNKVRYYNRTWECYTYQTCMRGLVEKVLDDEQKRYITDFKEKNGISRLTSQKKDIILAEFNKQSFIQDLMEIKERISTRNFD